MKRTFILLVMTFVLMICHAQKDNRTIEQRIDSLEIKFNKLQHDYDYLSCKFELTVLSNSLNILVNEIRSKTNSILIDCFHGEYNAQKYQLYKADYESFIELLKMQEININLTKNVILDKIEMSMFYEHENDRLKTLFNLIDASLSNAKTSLKLYDSFIGVYRTL